MKLTFLRILTLVSCAALQTAPCDAQTADPKSTPAEPKAPDDASKEPKKTKRPTPVVFGYIQTFYRHTFGTGPDGRVDPGNFRVQRVRLGVKGDVFPWLSYDVEIDPRSPQITGVLRDAFVSFKFIKDHQLRVGQQKTQFGYENPESSSDLYVVNRTELSEGLARGVNLRDIGVGLIGHRNFGGKWRFEDAITVVNGAGMNVQADNTPRKNVWGRLGLRYRNTPSNLTVRVGASGAVGDNLNEGSDPLDPKDDFREDFKRLGADMQIDHSRFFVTAEYARGTDKNLLTGESNDSSAYYVQVVGKTPWRVGPIARFDTSSDDFRRWTLGAFYGLPKEPFRVLVNYEYRKLRDGVRADDRLYVWTQVRF